MSRNAARSEIMRQLVEPGAQTFALEWNAVARNRDFWIQCRKILYRLPRGRPIRSEIGGRSMNLRELRKHRHQRFLLDSHERIAGNQCAIPVSKQRDVSGGM